MAGCERCWSESAGIYASGMGRGDSHADVYHEVLRRRDAEGRACTPAEQAGHWWDPVRQVDTRFTPPEETP